MIKFLFSNESTKKRIFKELKDVVRFQIDGFLIFGLIEDKLYGVLEGPTNSFYENGFFQFKMIYPNDYPFHPPIFYFQTKIFHPFINGNGFLNINILKDEWSPAYDLSIIIKSIQFFLYELNFDDCVNIIAAKLYKENKSEYEKTVRKYTSEYANFEIVQNELKKLNFKMELSD